MHRLLFFWTLAIGISCSAKEEHTEQLPAEKHSQVGEDRSDKLKWFLEAKYGMFIHWGLYAIPAGEWKGEMQEGHSEWIQYTAQIPAVEYEKLAA